MTTQTYQQASQRVLGPSQAGTGRRRSPAGIREGLGGYRPKYSRPSPNSAAGNTADTGITTESSADSGQKPVTATLPTFSPWPACSTRTSTKTSCHLTK